MQYAYEHFKRELLMEDMAWHAGPRPGQEMPDFDLPTTDGGRLRKGDFGGVRPLLLTFGSVTCPMTADADPKLKHLHGRFGDRLGFATLYVREAHPGDRYPQPDTLERKLQFARALSERDGLPWPVAVDTVDGELHRRLDAKPNACYVMDTGGRVAFRALWSNDREEVIAHALEEVLAGRSPVSEHNGRIVPMMRGLAHVDEILERSGPRRAAGSAPPGPAHVRDGQDRRPGPAAPARGRMMSRRRASWVLFDMNGTLLDPAGIAERPRPRSPAGDRGLPGGAAFDDGRHGQRRRLAAADRVSAGDAGTTPAEPGSRRRSARRGTAASWGDGRLSRGGRRERLPYCARRGFAPAF